MAGPSGKPTTKPVPMLRLDKWLWQARFAKSRTLAATFIAEGHVRVNGTPVSRPGREVTPGDVLTFPQGHAIRVVRILALGIRRGPFAEAQTLYEDLHPPQSGLAGTDASPSPLE